ncbi:hypothetical protein N2152v2_002816 [Parachlorella kessleri]
MPTAEQRSTSCAGGLAEEQVEAVKVAVEGVRHASTLAVKQRMKSVASIQKITKAMKMVAASKMRSAQLATEKSRGIVAPFVKLLGDLPDVDVAKNITVPITTDRGLCGGINTTVCKYARATTKTLAGGEALNQAVLVWESEKENQLIVVGEKGRSQLQRDMRNSIIATIADTNKVRITFPQVSAIAEELLKTEFDAARLIFNRFQSAIAYKPTIATVLSPDNLEKEAAEGGGGLDQYEIEGPDRPELLADLAEFQLAATLYNCLLENNCSEQSSRMAAMENSTKNAGEMLGKLTLTYNRTRQASITTELIEIISGATALAEK